MYLGETNKCLKLKRKSSRFISMVLWSQVLRRLNRRRIEASCSNYYFPSIRLKTGKHGRCHVRKAVGKQAPPPTGDGKAAQHYSAKDDSTHLLNQRWTLTLTWHHTQSYSTQIRALSIRSNTIQLIDENRTKGSETSLNKASLQMTLKAQAKKRKDKCDFIKI